MNTIQDVKIINFKDFGDERGKLVVIEGNRDIPFEIKRVFYIYESDRDIVRGQHANRESEFVLINVSGTSKVKVYDGMNSMVYSLDRPMMGIYIPQMIWKDMYDFSKDSVLLVISNEHYKENEYVRNLDDYNLMMNCKEKSNGFCNAI